MLRARDGAGANVSSNRNDRSLWMFFSNGVRRCQTIYRLGVDNVRSILYDPRYDKRKNRRKKKQIHRAT